MRPSVLTLIVTTVLTDLVTIGCQAAAAPAAQEKSISQQNQKNNLIELSATSLGDRPDPRFRMRGNPGARDVEIVSLLFNIVNGIAALAKLDFTSRVPGIRVPQMPQRYDVDVTIKPVAPATDIEIRLAIWGLYFTVLSIARNGTYKEQDVDLIYDDVIVANLIIIPKVDATAGNSANSTDLIVDRTSLGSSNNTILSKDITATIPDQYTPSNSSASISPLTDRGLHNNFQYLLIPPGEYLTPINVFITVLAILQHVAQYPSLAHAQALGGSAPGFDCRLEVHPEPRARSPYLHWSSVIDTIKLIPSHMMSKMQWSEMSVTAAYGISKVGFVMIMKGAPEQQSSTDGVATS